MTARAISALLVSSLCLSHACPFSNRAERFARDPQRRTLLASAPAPAGEQLSAKAFAGRVQQGQEQDGDAYRGPKPYHAPTDDGGHHPDLSTIFNDKDMHSTLTESLHRLGATVDSVLSWVHHALPGILAALHPVKGAEHNMLPAALEQIHEAMDLAHTETDLALDYTFENFPLIVAEHLKESLYHLEQHCKLQHLDETYKTVFQVMMITVPPGTYGLALRLAFHDAGTWNYKGQPGRKGGANASIRYEFDWPSNGGLQRFIWPAAYATRQILDVILPGNSVSYADIIAIGGAVGVFMSQGPVVNVGWGRPEVAEADVFNGVGSDTNDARDYPIEELLHEWTKFGFNATELTVLSGGHSIGIAASTNPQGKLDGKGAFHFGNQYYRNVLAGNAFFGSDKALANNAETRALCERFAVDQDVFYQYWIPIYTRMTMLGVDPTLDLHATRY